MKMGEISHLPVQDFSVSYAELKVKEITYYGIRLMDNKKNIDNALDGDHREKLFPVPFSTGKKLCCVIASAWVHLLKALIIFFHYIVS